ncbi:hypothetical protein Cgig2_002039 [Carnegiea gigantea]|uniref:Uncharacterized protein n=1 Tax=Carnegiea gigantea TaxID=171969 RepID=A0A9Q1K643_9CARY|nr:hypothetical protein Cgig2_002039 [Carnegiea gigantea]
MEFEIHEAQKAKLPPISTNVLYMPNEWFKEGSENYFEKLMDRKIILEYMDKVKEASHNALLLYVNLLQRWGREIVLAYKIFCIGEGSKGHEEIGGGIEGSKRVMQLKEIELWKLVREVKGEHYTCGAFAELGITPVNEEMGLHLLRNVNSCISSVAKGERLSHAKGYLKGSVMDKEFTENSASSVEENCVDIGVFALQQTYIVISLAQPSPSVAFCSSIVVNTNNQLQMHTWFSAPIPH